MHSTSAIGTAPLHLISRPSSELPRAVITEKQRMQQRADPCLSVDAHSCPELSNHPDHHRMKQKSLPPGQALGRNDMQQNRHGVIGHPGQMNECIEAQCGTPAFRDRRCGCETSLICAPFLPLLLFSWPNSVRGTDYRLWAQHEELSRV